MLEHFRRSFPHVPAICAPIQSCELEPDGFDAAVAWGVLFHLPHDEQRQAVANISRALKPGGPFLFTSGDQHGSIEGAPMNGVPFRYHSFSIAGYRDLLREHALSLEETHADAGGNTHYLALKGVTRSAARPRDRFGPHATQGRQPRPPR
jgi:SAM-dependent methyltransferase